MWWGEAPDAPLDGKEGLTFTIDGCVYVQKEVDSKLAKTWDVIAQNRRMLRTVLLRLAT